LSGTADGRSNGEFTLDAPHAGRLTEDDFVVGQRIEPGKTLFRLVDESTVWVDAKLPSESASHVKAGHRVIISGGRRIAEYGHAQCASHLRGHAQRDGQGQYPTDDRLLAATTSIYFRDNLKRKRGIPNGYRLAVPTALVRSIAKPWCSDARQRQRVATCSCSDR
jgi:cobalt-zinc-cadmium efflux system membrane fusion protein